MIMICKSCSAEYDDNILVCPYCGSENKKAAQELKEDILEAYDKEAEMIQKTAEQYPEKTARKWTKTIVRVVVVIIILGIIVSIVAIVAAKLSVSAGYKKEQRYLSELEELYQAGDYAAVETYLRDKELWSSAYEKYDEIARVYAYYAYMENDMKHIEDILSSEISGEEKPEVITPWCENVLEDAASTMELSKKYAEDMQFLGNEEELTNLYEDVVTQLEQMGYSKEEIDFIEQIKKDNIPEELLDKLLDFYLE